MRLAAGRPVALGETKKVPTAELPETVLLPYTAARGPTYALAATLARESTQPPPLECQRPPPGAAGLTWPLS